MGNLTSLEILDLSNNDLDDLNPEGYEFKLPENVSQLYFGNNRLHTLPTEALANLTKLTVLDLTDNQMGKIDYKLLKKIKTGLSLLISGKAKLVFH